MATRIVKKGPMALVYRQYPGFSHGAPAHLFELQEVQDDAGVVPGMRSFGTGAGELVGVNGACALYRVRSNSGWREWSNWFAVGRISGVVRAYGEVRPGPTEVGRMVRPAQVLPAELIVEAAGPA